MTTLLFWVASFAGLLLVHGVNTWLPTMMRASGYNLGSAISFLLVINLGGIAGMLVAGRLADRFGWFTLTGLGVGLLAIPMPLPVTYVVVFLTGSWLFSAKPLVYAAVGGHYPAKSRATALGWVAGIGRFAGRRDDRLDQAPRGRLTPPSKGNSGGLSGIRGSPPIRWSR
ncbi:hypothetical protein L3Q67_31255 [Saccharothrix sp. AJ9571]|nr:hypothetical protein L3Q67_31255 [Saccharothrix sp. AJ9571]